MSAIYSANEQAAAMAAANAAPNGQKEATFLSVWQQRLGANPTLNLYRNGTKVWSAAISGLLPADTGALIVPTVVTPLLNMTADIDTGTWQFRIEKASDSSVYYGADVSKTGGTDVLALSDDLDVDTILRIGEMRFNAPSLDSVTQVLARNDSRILMWTDPNYSFAEQLSANYLVQIKSANFRALLQSIPEPGVAESGGYSLSRVSSPYSDRMCFQHRLDKNFPPWIDNTQRSQILCDSPRLQDGETYWIGLEYSVESNWPASGFTLGDIHHENVSGGHAFVRAPLEVWGGKNYTAVTTNGNLTPGQTNEIGNEVWSTSGLTAGDILRLVIRFRVGRVAADNTFCQVWYSKNGGTLTLVGDRSGIPIGYNGMAANSCYGKFGLYYWQNQQANYINCTTYSKGALLIREAGGTPTLSAQVIHDAVVAL